MKAHAKKATITDVARIAGVSTATVSRSLSAPGLVSAESRARVVEAVSQTGYIANSAAQILRRRRADAVLMAVPDLGNTFFSEIISGVETVARERGVAVLVSDVPRGGGAGRRLSDLLEAGRADGALVLHGALLPGAEERGHDWKIVTVSEEVPVGRRATAHVGIDNTAASADATAHLIGLGHRRIWHVHGPAETVLTSQRRAGYEATMRAAGLDAEIRSLPGDFTIASGHRVVETLLAEGSLPDALCCANDEMAIGAMNALAAAGVDVPGQVSVMGLDDIAFAAWSNPPLSTIRQPRHEIGRRAMRELLSQIDGAAPSPPVRIAHKVIVRASTKAHSV